MQNCTTFRVDCIDGIKPSIAATELGKRRLVRQGEAVFVVARDPPKSSGQRFASLIRLLAESTFHCLTFC